MASYEIAAAEILTEKPAVLNDNRVLADSLWREAILCLEKRGYEKASEYLAEALALVPEHPGCLAALALCLAEGQHKYLTAEKLARRAVCLAPRSAHGYHAIGRIYTYGGKLAQARDNLRRAQLLSPNDLRIKYDLEVLKHKQQRSLQTGRLLKIWGRGLDGFRDFIAKDRHLVLVTCMLLATIVGFALMVLEQAVEGREMELARFENQKAYQMFSYAHERTLLRHR